MTQEQKHINTVAENVIRVYLKNHGIPAETEPDENGVSRLNYTYKADFNTANNALTIDAKVYLPDNTPQPIRMYYANGKATTL